MAINTNHTAGQAAASNASAHHGSDASLSIGFLSCLILTITGYTIVQTESLSLHTKILIIAGLAFAQFVIQMIFFLHLGRERKPRYKLQIFWAMVAVVGTLIIGSLWIMYNLDYNMMYMSESDQRTYMNENQGF